jgi:CDGSH-type Zn-finger protein
MREPKIAARGPILLELEPGTYYWCRCGHSQNQPFCDGSHKQVPGFAPLEFKITEKKKRSYCRCKRSGNAPFCDGTHKTLPE